MVPVWIKGNGKKVKVNAVLDDASTGTFLNEEIAICLGVQSAYEKVTVRGGVMVMVRLSGYLVP